MKTAFAAILCVLTFNSFAQSPEFRHDIGLRLGSFDQEQFQLEYRYHFNEKWSFGARGYFGLYRSLTWDGGYLVKDSIFQSNNIEYQRMTYGISFGAQRRLNFMKHNYYYVGVNLGFGTTQVRNTYNRMVYVIDFDPSSPANAYSLPPVGDIIEKALTVDNDISLNLRNHLCVGADVPVLDKLSLNLEIGVISDLQFPDGLYLDQFQMMPYASGGLRYRFGKLDNI